MIVERKGREFRLEIEKDSGFNPSKEQLLDLDEEDLELLESDRLGYYNAFVEYRVDGQRRTVYFPCLILDNNNPEEELIEYFDSYEMFEKL